MKLIKCLAENMKEELADAEKYAKLALMHKEDNTKAANLFIDLSREELNHMNRLHELATRTISEFEGEKPEAMKAVWEYVHEGLIEREKEVRIVQAMF